MNVAYTILTPWVVQAEILETNAAELYRQWRAYHREIEASFKIENIRFEHDPTWKTRFLSIQCAHDRNHPVWKAAGIFVDNASVVGGMMAL